MAKGCPRCGYVRTTYGDPEVGAKLKRMRLKAGLSLTELSALSGRPSSTIGAIERGVRKAARATVNPVLVAIRKRSEELREALGSIDEQAEAKEERVLCVQSGGEMGDSGVPAVVSTAT